MNPEQSELQPEPQRQLPPPSRDRRRAGHGNGRSARDGTADDALARGLGWFSVGLGLAEVLAPRGIARFLGIEPRNALVRTMGVREITSGLGILSQPKPAGWLWSRVGGDALDLGLLLAALERSVKPGRVVASIAAVGGVTLLDVLAGDRLSRRSSIRAGAAPSDGSVEVMDSIAVNATAEEAYGFWQQLENLPRFMPHLELVQQNGPQRSHWIAKGPLGTRVEWDAEIVRDVPNEEIAWESLPGSEISNSGVVRFLPEPAGRGTVIEVQMRYRPMLGAAGKAVARLIGEEPEQQIRSDLRRLKQIMETGEVPTIEGQPSGRSRGRDRAVAGPAPLGTEVH